jgi:uncharacterized protein
MKHLSLILLLLFSTTCWSADFQKGATAYTGGDYAIALREWTRSCRAGGDTNAQYLLGAMYRKGQGAPQDYKTALQWFRLAVEQGDADAQSNLGLGYALGQGVLKDYVYAHMWGNVASFNGQENGGQLRDLIEAQMTPSQIEKSQDLARECLANNYKDC